MSASRLSAIVLALLFGVLAAGRSACLEYRLPTVAEKTRGMSSTVPGRFALMDAGKPGRVDKGFKGTGHALLVGCTRYDNPDVTKLDGPINDVELMKGLLLERGFVKGNIVILSEAPGNKRPIKANIKAGFKHLADVAKEGDLVVIHLAGHGSRQPTTRPPELAKPGGLDETFLPADIGKWDGSAKTVRNAITDTEISKWLKDIRDKKASVVFIADACHSSTLARDPEERDRRVEPEKLVPREALFKAGEAARSAEKKRGGAPSKLPFTIPAEAPDLAALYAAQTTEPTPERLFPANSPDAKHYGLFTYTLVKVVREARAPLTYRDLIQRIQSQYTAMGRFAPTPAVEGKDRDHEFLATGEFKGGASRGHPTFYLKRDERGWKVDGGSIHGLTRGTILAVYPSDAAVKEGKPLGHVRVTQVAVLSARVEPVAYAGKEALKELPKDGACQPVFVDYGGQKFRVAYAAGRQDPLPKEKVSSVEEILDALQKAPGSLLQVEKDPRLADWVVVGHAGKVALADAAAWRRKSAQLLGPAPVDDKLSAWLQENLGRVARARNLLRLTGDAGRPQAFGGDGPDVVLELFRMPDGGGEPIPIRPEKGQINFTDGERFRVRLTNRGREAVYVTLLFVDADYGITCIFPKPRTTASNRLLAEESLTVGTGTVNAKTVGLERFVLIAVTAKGGEQPMDFSCLEQPSIAKARALDKKSALDSPLGKMFQSALYGKGKERHVTMDQGIDYSLRVLTWHTSPRGPEKPKQGSN